MPTLGRNHSRTGQPTSMMLGRKRRSASTERAHASGQDCQPEVLASSREVIRADSKMTGRPLPGWVPPPTR